jgi:hypothetical protein
MKRVYLDQNKWIDLMRARYDQKGGERYTDAHTVARAGVEHGLVSFPLSDIHYMEVAHRSEWRSRHRLAATMGELSRFHTVAPQAHVVPAEIDRALHARFGRPLQPRPLQVFGVGVRHAIGYADRKGKLPDDFPLERVEDLARQLGRTDDFELAVLSGPPENTPTADIDTTAHRHVSADYQKREEELSERLKGEGWGKGDRLRRVMLASALVDILEVVNDALEEARLSADQLIALGEDGMTEFLEDISSRWVLYEMRRDLHARGQHEEGDLRDLAALSIAVAYCDVVVTEKQWVHVLTRARVDEKMNTVLLSDVAKLPEAIV